MPLRAAPLCRAAAGGSFILDLSPHGPALAPPRLDGTVFLEGVFDGATVTVSVRGREAWLPVTETPLLAPGVLRLDAQALGVKVEIGGGGPATAITVSLLAEGIPPVREEETPAP